MSIIMDSCACSTVWIYELDYLHLKGFLHSKYELYVEQPLTPPQCNHRLAIEIGWWLTNPRDGKLYYCCSYNVVENETWFMLEHSVLNFITAKIPSLFQNVSTTRQAQVFLQIGPTMMIFAFISWRAIALLYSRELPFVLLSWCNTSSPISLLAS